MRARSSPACRPRSVREIHVAGHARNGGVLIDDHGSQVCDAGLGAVPAAPSRASARCRRWSNGTTTFRRSRRWSPRASARERILEERAWPRCVSCSDSFAAALRDPAVACAVLPPANLAIYRNNASSTFRTALELTFPVVRRRVGDDYFRQLARHYRQRFPSRSGDLHWVGPRLRGLPRRLSAGGEYAWLADLARLEWSRAECLGRRRSCRRLGVDALARFAAARLEHLVFGLQPSLQLHRFAIPVFTVWLANQVENAPPVDQSLGSEQGMVRARSICRCPPPGRRSLLFYALSSGHPLANPCPLSGFRFADPGPRVRLQ